MHYIYKELIIKERDAVKNTLLLPFTIYGRVESD